MHIARLIAITEVRNVPPDIRPFVEFRAAVEERKLVDDERVAILNIDTTSCYVPVFLKDPPTMADLEHIDSTTVRGFLGNKVVRVLMVTALANVGCNIGVVYALPHLLGAA